MVSDGESKAIGSPKAAYESVPVAAVILAAGGSARMGDPKQLLPLRGQPMLTWVAEAACQAGLAQVIVVLGAHADTVRQALEGLDVDLVLNESWTEGMASSLRIGVQAIRPELGAVIAILADQPLLGPDLIRLLVDRWQATGAPIVAPFFRGQRGNPVLFDRALFSELAAVTGDQGGRGVIEAHKARMERVEVHDPGVLLDVDTRQDYQRARKAVGRGAEGGRSRRPDQERPPEEKEL